MRTNNILKSSYYLIAGLSAFLALIFFEVYKNQYSDEKVEGILLLGLSHLKTHLFIAMMAFSLVAFFSWLSASLDISKKWGRTYNYLSVMLIIAMLFIDLIILLNTYNKVWFILPYLEYLFYSLQFSMLIYLTMKYIK